MSIAAIGGTGGRTYIVTVAQSGTRFGTDTHGGDNYGSVSPTTYKGDTIGEVISINDANRFRWQVNNGVTSLDNDTYFRGLLVQTDAGGILLLRSAAALHDHADLNYNAWEWNMSPDFWTSAGVKRAFTVIG